MNRLERFKKEETNRKKIIKILSAFMIVGIILSGISYAVYQKEEEKTFINAKVGDFKVYLSNITATSTYNSITLNYTASGLNSVATCKYGINTNYTSSINNATNTNCNITGLAANTTYYYQICAKNNLNQEACKTGSIATKYNPPTLSNITATSTASTIDLSYTESGTVSSRTCKYSTTSGSYTTNGNSQTSTKCSITGLKGNTTYYYQVCTGNNGGQSCKTGSIKTKPFSNLVNVGDYISMTPTSTSYTISTSLTGYTSNQTINPSELNLWRVIRKNSDGTVDVVSEYVSSVEVYFYGQKGYMNSVGTLNTIAAQYTNSKYVSKTRNMGYNNQIEACTSLSESSCPTDKGYETDNNLIQSILGTLIGKTQNGVSKNYWLASRKYVSKFVQTIRIIKSDGSLDWLGVVNSGGKEFGMAASIRPIITLKADVIIKSGDGKSVGNAYQLN